MATIKRTFPVKNMMCAMCVQHVQKALASAEGVKSVNVNLASNSALIEYDDTLTSPEAMKGVVDAAGYCLVIDAAESTEDAIEEAQKKTSKSFLKKLFGR
ncbi:MAG: heavy-metal-associated domain-containing protein [Candidatus Egerieousia sp.]